MATLIPEARSSPSICPWRRGNGRNTLNRVSGLLVFPGVGGWRGRAALAGCAFAVTLAAAAVGNAAPTAFNTPRHPQAPDASSPAFGPFHWSAAPGADHYEFQLAADSRFNSPVLGSAGSFSTRNTIATVSETLPDGTYWWRVRAVRSNGSVSAWRSKSFRHKWAAAPALIAPAQGASISFPTEPLLLAWRPLIGAVRYEVSIATDSALSSLVGGKPVTTAATSFIPPATFAEGTYYWSVTPVDAEGHEGAQSSVRSFKWAWPTGTKPNLADLVSAPEFFDPLLSWAPVAGAARYELDVNYSEAFDPGSRVCCTAPTIATGYSPPKNLPNNTYYWRVRPVNVQGSEGIWTPGQSLFKTFDNVPPVGGSSISGLHMRDNLGDGGAKPAGWATSAPVIAWNPVIGASAYDVDVVPFAGGGCDWTAPGNTHWHVQTATTAWTPLGVNPTGVKPYPSSLSISHDGATLVAGRHYCARIRAIADSDTTNQRIYGDYTYLEDAFSYSPDAPAGSFRGAASSDYVAPVGGARVSQTPLLTWRAVPGARAYWVIVSRDQSFTTIADYAFTQVPAYAPRNNAGPRTYADETTSYYWAILPAANPNGTGTSGDPLRSSPATFNKLTTPPTLMTPTEGFVLAGAQPQFEWSAVEGARNYRLQVSTDPNFGTALLENLLTASTAYVSTTNYPAQATVYWRVQPNDETNTALTWSKTGSFRRELPAPTLAASNLRKADTIPSWRWASVPGAVAYDVRVTRPNGGQQVFSSIPVPAAVPVKLSGTGVFRWQVRAEFPRGTGGTVPGPWSKIAPFTRTVPPPAHLGASVSGRTLLLHWTARPGIKTYRVEVASRQDFSQRVDTETTEQTALAPTLTQGGYGKGGVFYWHVAAVDADGNQGSFGPTRSFRFHGTGKR
jgi:hypothetical protein